MQNIIIDKPYRFVPPKTGAFWTKAFGLYLPTYLRKSHGVETWEVLGAERLKASLDAGHGTMLAANHCRPCDPMVLGLLVKMVRRPVYVMSSWHLFMQGWLNAWMLPRLGVFSVYREGMDREALKCAIRILTEARRPLILFPEGVVSRTNDRMNQLMDGTAFIARNAAKQRAAMTPAGKAVVHPVAIRYFFGGNCETALAPVLEEIERRLTWQPRPENKLLDRIRNIGAALLALKEIEYLGAPQSGELTQRLTGLIDHLLTPLEAEWLKGKREGDVVGRVKALRMAILPDMAAGEISEDERARRWRQLADTYLAQQIYLYPPEYFSSQPTPEQLLETVERFEEDLTDKVRVYHPIHAVIEVGEAIEVNPARDRSAATDPLMAEIRQRLETMLESLKSRRPAANPS
ncbi:MAG: 1-acyl-sn-glycerol-3-phosphate acyltransferase [Candidatus Sumerlaeota bacterium]|nr:1-acyl-sn-glycerol-3-phosphate acyltransferase [Candidatus Sumerlaeota bacterium]